VRHGSHSPSRCRATTCGNRCSSEAATFVAASSVAHAPRPRRDSADDEIVRRIAAEPEPAQIRVVTSDLWLVDRVHAVGATVQSADAFRAWIEDS